MPVSSPALMNPTAEFPKCVVASIHARTKQSLFSCMVLKKKKRPKNSSSFGTTCNFECVLRFVVTTC